MSELGTVLLVIIGTVIGTVVGGIILYSIRDHAKRWIDNIVRYSCELVMTWGKRLVALLWEVYHRLSLPVIRRALYDYKYTLLVHCYTQMYPLADRKEAHLIGSYDEEGKAQIELLRVKFGAAGGLEAYRNIAAYLFGDDSIARNEARKQVNDDLGRLMGVQFYEWKKGEDGQHQLVEVTDGSRQYHLLHKYATKVSSVEEGILKLRS